MNKQQREYAMRRVSNIAREKMKHLKSLSELSYAQQIEILKKAKLKLKDNRPHHMDPCSVIDWSAYIPKAQKNEAEKKLKALDQRVQEITDELYLGDCERALELIKQFSEE